MTDQRGQRGIDTVYSELETVSRRAVARARHKSAPLSFVEHSLVTFIATHPGCRATDIAADFGLNRSTVSRQLGGLVELGLVEPGAGAAVEGRRGQALTLTARGRDLLARSVDANRSALADRLEGWTAAEVDALAAALHRLNSAFVD
ncbi:MULTISPECIES: MarR family winged helix-turn-helix transcriptional regulator [Frigoribacterium]|uniref:MarR family winged helix-turn-helix transcriptional regulator n=1 Tax=Frigoribacterium TaxID=96492 RepID=UPI000F46CA19|nr:MULTISPECIES: MarR family winged helix-turn-helix transcriptional regulator [Frigoribacterium]MBD8141502.1 winged helix-turn-helix transcriptional regulator [Frigoribacterium sp. CFBP 13605]NQW86737.1 winged helix-turn-helix transcriptional regulator [Frigoribacterium sp. VKM Ac-2860]NQX08068.1 winged helix-turn-helix transcriptional regulator [Frigoribacterium sp. VKM Ac-2859]ROS57493.1 DNA-binding MarR family transcriptional regulator [Frigoribacterium sp. PhB118]